MGRVFGRTPLIALALLGFTGLSSAGPIGKKQTFHRTLLERGVGDHARSAHAGGKGRVMRQTTALPTVTCGRTPAAPAQTIFDPAVDHPHEPDNTDGKKLVLGMKFVVEKDVTITAVRYFKAPSEDNHLKTGYLYTPDGNMMAFTPYFDDSHCPGGDWVQIELSEPFHPDMNKEYYVAIDYVNYYPKTEHYFPPCKESNGLVAYNGSFSLVPTQPPLQFRWRPSNYYLDFVAYPVPPAPTPAPTAPPTKPPPPASRQLTCDVTPAAPAQTIFDPAVDHPHEPDNTDGKKLVLGMKFIVEKEVTITAMRYLKSPSEDNHLKTGYLYTPDGNMMAFTPYFDDSACHGPSWVTVNFTTPFDPEVGKEYYVAVDYVNYYPKTEHYFPPSKNSDGLIAINGSFSLVPTQPPLQFRRRPSNYYLDFVAYPKAAKPKPVTCDVTPAAPAQTIFNPAVDHPAQPDNTDGKKLVLGMRFRADKPIRLTAMRYLKSPSENNHLKTGYIYAPDGNMMAFTPFFDDSECHGPSWVTATFTTPFEPEVGKDYYVAVDYVNYYPKTEHYFPPAKDSHGLVGIDGSFSLVPTQPPLQYTHLDSNYHLDVVGEPLDH